MSKVLIHFDYLVLLCVNNYNRFIINITIQYYYIYYILLYYYQYWKNIKLKFTNNRTLGNMVFAYEGSTFV